MKLFTKEIDKKLAAQYHLGADLNAQMVVAKIFNPYGNGRWFLVNSDPADPDYLWAIVQIGDVVEVGSVSRKELERLRVGRFGFPLERDLGFSQRNAQEVYNGLLNGKFYAKGGMADTTDSYAVGGLTPGRWYKDNQGVEYKFIGKIDNGPDKDKLLFNDGTKSMFKTLDEFGEKPKENKLFGWFEKGGEVLKKYGFETIDDAVKALKSGDISTTKFMDILYEYEVKGKGKLKDGGYMADGGKLSVDRRLAYLAKLNKYLQDQLLGKKIEGWDVYEAPEPMGLYFKNEKNDLVLEPNHIWLDPKKDEYDLYGINIYYDKADVNLPYDNIFHRRGLTFDDIPKDADKFIDFITEKLKRNDERGPYKRKKTTKDEKIALEILENAWKKKGEDSGITQAAWDRIQLKYYQGDRDLPSWLVIKYANGVKRDNQDLYKVGDRDYMTEDEVLAAIAKEIGLSVEGKDDTRLDVLVRHFGSKQDEELLKEIDEEKKGTLWFRQSPILLEKAEELHARLLKKASKKMAEKNIPFVYLNTLAEYKPKDDDYKHGGYMADGGEIFKHVENVYKDENGVIHIDAYTTSEDDDDEDYDEDEGTIVAYVFPDGKFAYLDARAIHDKNVQKIIKESGGTSVIEDLFEVPEYIPQEIQEILDKYNEGFDGGDYEALKKAQKEVQEYGFTFDYDLGGGAFDLHVVDDYDAAATAYDKGDDGDPDYPDDWDDYANGGVIKVGDTIRIKDGLNLGSLMNLEGQDLEVKKITNYEFASGVKKYYHVVYDGNKYEVREDFVANQKMADGGKLNIGTIKKTDTSVLFDKQSGKFYANVIDGLGNRINKLNVNTIDDLFEDYPTFRLNTTGEKEFPESMADGGYNDPILIAMRANQGKAKLQSVKGNQNQGKISMLLKERARIEREMEQEAELEGGPKADKYATMLIKIDQDIKKLKNKMAMGGTTKFADKVKSIQASLLKRKKVAPSVQKDYGKTYNKAEAKESAKRIVGAMTAKERLMAKKKMADGGLVSEKPKFKKLMNLEDRAKASRDKARNYAKWNTTIGENYRRRWYKMAEKLRGWGTDQGYSKTKPEWVKYCKEQNIVEDYNFGDVLA